MKAPRFLVGIDLGTTHTVVAYADMSNGLDKARRRLFEIEQLVAPGEVASKPLLPSFRYHPTQGELADEDLLLPWSGAELPGELDGVVVGEWARELGSKVEGRLVASAKSWLSHPQVDRSAAILPWAAAEDVAKVSPVLASASYLDHVRRAWNQEHRTHLLENQEVVVTVPASFDEAARSLTIEAAAMAGLPEVLLLEEPQAVCYDWYARNKTQAAELLQDSRLLLVCDVGGGTTDLSLIRVDIRAGDLALTRVGVGDHLMLGGDNVDLALAHRAEQRIVQGGKKLRAASLSQLIQQTRKAKELLLVEQAPESAKVTVLGAGARLIGGARSCDLSRQEVRELALDGFFPMTDFDERPGRRRSAMVEFGLPYAADPAVSKHVAAFLARHATACREALQLTEGQEQPAIPDTVLFNGGVFNSPALKERSLSVLSRWAGKPVRELANDRPDLSVAYGAVAYGMARHGAQLKIGGGSARSFFLLLDQEKDQRQGVCLLPKGTEAGQEISLEERRFGLRLGEPVQFHLLSSTADTAHAAGALSVIDDGEFVSLPPLVAALDKTYGDPDEVEVGLVTTLTEVGTLQIDCVSLADSRQRWNVEFQIRRDLAQRRQGVPHTTAALPPKFDRVQEKLEVVYGQRKKQFDPKAVRKLRGDLEQLLGKRDAWETPVLRALFDELLACVRRLRRSQAHERIWFNLAGFSLRPGFGYPLDDWRVQQIWPLYEKGLQYARETQSWSDWWTCWRRAAGGLDQQQQQRLFDDIAVYIDPAALRNRKTIAELRLKSYEDMVRLVASLENLPVTTKIELGEWLLTRLKRASETPTSWWALGRIAARVPFHGSAHNVIPKMTVHAWLPRLLEQDWRQNQNAAFAAVMMGRMSGDRARDLDDEDRETIVERLKAARGPALWSAMVTTVKELDDVEIKRVFGEKLPAGLKLIV
jgi:molecular chaperone DnaK (HSP70)